MVKLNLESDQPKSAAKKNNRALKIGLGVGALVLVPVIGMTFAASITINSGTAVQFGQGFQAATACDSAITITPTSSFSTPTFSLATLALSSFDTNACAGKKITVKVLNSSGTEQAVSNGTSPADTRIVFTLPASAGAVTEDDATNNYTISDSNKTSSDTITITLTTKPAATSVDAFTIESA